ncbi:ester cyclase [Inconstantimicrobium mannanitabidum]|uniref:Uncharacterized protein n=1 Tax=Inconstantimicrobium mannanitabidum TaxID=1604901 RepID=A0ACB5R832_9CLOT|nr:ester cyclase [Clostridium sp. TW13]GKX65179.1 hypothetical protein rsdtw13_04370 [Clostridium sp. TW13]
MRIEVNDKSFEIIKLLGKGKGGYSYLVTDGDKEYIVKKIHHEPCSYYQFGNKLQCEIEAYKRLKSIGISLPEMYDVDVERELILKEYIDGNTIFDMEKDTVDVTEYIIQVNEMCKKLYEANTNIDYFPTNFIPQKGQLYYIDYECNDYMEEWNFENWGIKYWQQTKELIGYINKEIVRKFFIEGYVNHDYDKVMSIVADNYIDHSPAGAKSNKDAIGILKIVENMFKDLKVEIMDIFEEGNMVASRIKYSGIHSGECMGIAATGKPITFEALENFKIKEGKIIESWGYWPDAEIKKILESK